MEKQNRLVIYPSPGMGDLVWITPHLRVLAKSIGPFSLLIPKSACAETLLKEEGFLNAILPFSRKVLTKEGTERNPDDYMHQGFKGFWRLVRDLKNTALMRCGFLTADPLCMGVLFGGHSKALWIWV
ncbi:MAG: hypothetical protein H6925_03400 [Holosporaceae bacterium]|nr:MAG: hypothetical protein H6925_03400 [Holosporaceae bacterium]